LALTVLLVVLALVAAAFIAFWWANIVKCRRAGDARHPSRDAAPPTLLQCAIGAVTDFLDALGVGSFATTTALFRAFRVVPDELIPGTLNVGHTLPTIAQAFIFVAAITVEPLTLILMILAAVAGSWLGAGIVSGWSRTRVRLVMGSALIVAAFITMLRQLQVLPKGADTIGLEGFPLVLGLAGNFALGAIMPMGIGLYAPCMVLVGLLGMNAKTAFPIMMGSCAFLMPVASARFVKNGAYSLRAALGLALGGIPAVLVAGLLVKELPLTWVQWLVVVIASLTGLMLIRRALSRGEEPAPEPVFD